MRGGTRYPRWAAAVTLPLALAGLGLSTYLTWAHYTEPRALSCPDSGIVNCTKVTTSPESMIFGVIPVALAGAVFFLVATALMTPMAWRARSRQVHRARVAAVVAGMGMVVYLVYAEAVVVRAICLYCTAVHVVTFALFVAVLAATLPADEPDDPADPAEGASGDPRVFTKT